MYTMKKTFLFFGLVSVLTLCLVASGAYASGKTGRTRFSMFDSSDLIGVPVKDSHGEIGFVDEVMIDTWGHALAVIYHAYRTDYDPLAYDGGVNTPVPFQELMISKAKRGQETVILKTDLEHLNFAPYLDPLKMENRQYEASIYEYYGIQPYWTWSGTPSKGTFTEADSRDLVGAAVENSCGKVVGVVNEVMVDSRGHTFAVVYHGDYDLYGDGGVNTPVPFQELTISKAKGGQEAVVLKTDMEHLDFAPYLDPLKMDSRRYEASIYEFYGIQPYWTQGGGLSK
jgi:ribosomal 30S subunit maturation factor RimM